MARSYNPPQGSGFVATPASDLMPVGSMVHWPANSAVIPTSYLPCDGRAISRTTFATLFAKIGTTWGVGDGVNTFNIPDFRHLYARAASIDGDLATAVGADTITLDITQIPAHTHSTPVFSGGGGGQTSSGGTSQTPSLPTGTAGGGLSHENRPASNHVYFIIKVQ